MMGTNPGHFSRVVFLQSPHHILFVFFWFCSKVHAKQQTLFWKIFLLGRRSFHGTDWRGEKGHVGLVAPWITQMVGRHQRHLRKKGFTISQPGHPTTLIHLNFIAFSPFFCFACGWTAA
jgi:hypothetical protein